MTYSVADEHYAQRGERLLLNWGDWCAEDTVKRLQLPNKAPFARLYSPDLGDVWVDSNDVDAEVSVDDCSAERVEREVLGMSDGDRYLLFLAYVRKLPVSSKRRGVPTLTRYMRRDEADVTAALRRLAIAVGRIKI